MRLLRTTAFTFAASLALLGCAADGTEGEGGERGKADHVLYGSCEDSCGGASLDGTCHCEDDCQFWGDCCEDADDFCELPEDTFEVFRISHDAFCAPEADCKSFVELQGDGTLFVDRAGDFGGTVQIATISKEDLADAAKLVNDPLLIAALDQKNLCQSPDEISESMFLIIDGVEHRKATLGCDSASLDQARNLMDALRDKYSSN